MTVGNIDWLETAAPESDFDHTFSVTKLKTFSYRPKRVSPIM